MANTFSFHLERRVIICQDLHDFIDKREPFNPRKELKKAPRTDAVSAPDT